MNSDEQDLDPRGPLGGGADLGPLEKIWRLNGHGNLVLRLATLGRLVDRCVACRLTEHDLNLAQWRTMALLAILGESTFASMAKQAWLDNGDLSRALNRLEARGLAWRRPHPTDRRSQICSLTPAGMALYDKLVVDWRDLKDDLEATFAGEELPQFERSLERLAHRCLEILGTV